jgi:endonuclease/exonuclease/phosphatase family metal-dependent hydrolase
MTAGESRVAQRGVDADGLPSAAFRPQIETTVTVVTWNVWHRFGPWERRWRTISHTLRRCRPDIVTLQEVPGTTAEGSPFVEGVASELGMHFGYSAYANALGVETGFAVLSRWPIDGTARESLPVAPGAEKEWGRSVFMARVAGPRGLIPVFTTHLSYTPEASALRSEQLTTVCEFVRQHASPAFPPILTGDFNADPASDEVRMLVGRTAVPPGMTALLDVWEMAGDGPGATWSNDNPWARLALEASRRIDYIFVGRPFRGGTGHPVAARLEGVEPHDGVVGSDHYAVWAQLRY